jgi:hypothetical protein
MTNILNEAEQAIFGERNQNYGHPRDNFTHTAALWSAHKGVEFSAQEVAEFMVLLKLSRLQNGYHRDSVVDIAGYAGTIERLQEGQDTHPAVRVYTYFEDVPQDHPVNSSDESDGEYPWYGDGTDGRDYGVGPWRDSTYRADDE